ncbi:MAG: Lrp/AsnC family transcriptional regulator [Candidatus Bathyarchaeia archaeon]
MVKRFRFRKRLKPVKVLPFTAFILIKIEGGLKETVKKIKKIPGVKCVDPVTGEYDLIVKLEAKNEDEVKSRVDRMRSIDSIKGTLTLSVRPPTPEVYTDVESRIREVVGETGTVEPKYGGYDITVLNESMFPWPTVFKLLWEYQFEIWVTEKEDRITISCKSPFT